MKNIIYLIAIFLFSGCMSGNYTQYSENYKPDKYERNGFTGSSTLIIKNKHWEDIVFQIDKIYYTVPANGKIKIELEKGFHTVSDGTDTLRLEAIPGNDYVHVFR